MHQRFYQSQPANGSIDNCEMDCCPYHFNSVANSSSKCPNRVTHGGLQIYFTHSVQGAKSSAVSPKNLRCQATPSVFRPLTTRLTWLNNRLFPSLFYIYSTSSRWGACFVKMGFPLLVRHIEVGRLDDKDRPKEHILLTSNSRGKPTWSLTRHHSLVIFVGV